MKQHLFKKHRWVGLRSSASALSFQMRQGVRALLRTLIKALRQPDIQYHIALLLAALLAVLIGWIAFLSTFPHPGMVTFIERC
jgi:hypothetical protein